MISFAYHMRNNPYALKAMFCASGLINCMTDDILVTEGASAWSHDLGRLSQNTPFEAPEGKKCQSIFRVSCS